jgi:hypothetical protein
VLKTVKPTRIINKLKFIYYFTAEIHFSAVKQKKYCLHENVNSNGTVKKSGHAQRDFCEAKILRREKRRNSRAVSSIFDDEVTLLWQNRLLFGLFRHALALL